MKGDTALRIFVVGLLVIVAYFVLSSLGISNKLVQTVKPTYVFTQAQIDQIQTDIRDSYQNQKDIEVDQVAMVKDSDRHLTGYVKFHKPGLFGIGQINLSRNCSATMDEDSGKGFWRCD